MGGPEPPPRPAVLCRSPLWTASRGRAGCQEQLAAATWNGPAAHLWPPCETGSGPQGCRKLVAKIPPRRGKRFPVRRAGASGPGGDGAGLQLAVDGEVQPLGVEAVQG